MLRKYQTSIGSFTRKSTFFWASVGATVGLANLWQFPYLASKYGGGLFILLYLACLLVVTLPLMVTEAVIGRHARHGIVLAMDGLVKNAGCSPFWRLAGPLSILAAFAVLSFTAVFGGIVLAYIFFGAADRFAGASTTSAAAVLSELVSDPGHYREFMAWHVFFLILVVAVSARGVVKGLERSMRLVVPCTLLLMLLLFVFSAMRGSLQSGIEHVLVMRPGQVTGDSLKAAFFHAFYTLGLGMGVWAIFGAYSTGHTRLKRSILAVVLMDTLVAIVAGLMMFSIAADGNSLDGERGFSLLFVSLPVTLSGLPYSQVILASVFLLVVLIVWATALSLLEPVVGWFREWTGAPRAWSAVIVGVAVWFAGLASLFSFNVWADYRLGGATVFRWLELGSGGVVIPVVAILIATFAGWCVTRRYAAMLLGNAPALFRKIWFWVMRLVLPVVAAWIGIQYTLFSLGNLCDNGSAAIWCQEAPVVEVPPAEGGSEVFGEGANDEMPLDAAEDLVVPAGHGLLESDEKAPKQSDILYHSV
ncbi:sodium-dependent transporter [Marinobacter daepoensis]|uniref:Sodium-dependent transporter n=1 Tax=Marinobacter daepoensis TaxID=262077 RepID=A0ABS3BG59_9GAMM|nr:sodium-dependent transporter [Marinobacter daepoensis]MBN7770654.1 sodium-dependent transporter [Marinobacter daepoensis]MBY6034010.1 sodium-dependent transporter [Marinobacter daepoensis]MBY6078515.1 sodium-dependent transporter [Marinobacter daepoensis]